MAITLLVKQPGPVAAGGGTISYHDIGDYLSRKEKLAAIAKTSIGSLPWQHLTPNEHHDWLNQRDDRYRQLVPLAHEPGAIFHTVSRGVKATSRDAWVYNSSEAALRRNVDSMIDFYNDQVRAFSDVSGQFGTQKGGAGQAKAFVDKDPTRFSWIPVRLHTDGERPDIRSQKRHGPHELVPALLQAVRRLRPDSQ